MIFSFLKHYLELPQASKRICLLGGGVGTAQVLKGLRNTNYDLTAIVSLADDGGSAGRLRRAFSVPPPGDIVNCLAALSEEESILKDLFLYRFSGQRYGKDTDLGGQKLGNLIFVALTDIYKGDVNKALVEFSRIISPKGRVLPATVGDVNIWAKTKKNVKVYGEENIDLGKYKGSKALKEVHLDPEDAKAYKPAIESIKKASCIIVGPGDLFSTVLPTIIVKQIKSTLKESKAKKILIVNITNKSFETPNFKVSDYIKTVSDHLGSEIFDTIIVNKNQKPKIPKGLDYKYVEYDKENLEQYSSQILEVDVVNSNYSIYHDNEKIGNLLSTICV